MGDRMVDPAAGVVPVVIMEATLNTPPTIEDRQSSIR